MSYLVGTRVFVILMMTKLCAFLVLAVLISIKPNFITLPIILMITLIPFGLVAYIASVSIIARIGVPAPAYR